jgi:transposase
VKQQKETTTMQYYIEEKDWEQIYQFLRTEKGIHTRQEASLRRFIEGIWYIARGGCQWRLLPHYYGHWRSSHRKFKRWAKSGIWGRMMSYFVDADLEQGLVDGTIVRAHACAAGYGKDSQALEALGRSKGGFTTKIHALVDALGNPLRFILSPGQRNEITQAEALIEGYEQTTVIADKGYDSSTFVQYIEDKGGKAVIPSRSNRNKPRVYDEHLYKDRHLIECFFGKIKHFRRIFSRFDKAASTYLAFLHFVGTLIWLR